MINKIKNSLGIKLFAGITLILVIVSLVLFSSVRVLMPKVFTQDQKQQLSNNLQTLASQLQQSSYDKFQPLLTEFAINNQASITIYDENQEVIASFAVVQKKDNDQNALRVASSADFIYGGRLYYIRIESLLQAVDQLEGTFTKVFPTVMMLILILSALAAYFYSRRISRPIIDISDISRKMTTLDMTWRCKVNRSDEIGTLADNLNIMAKELGQTMEDLQNANQKLQDDIIRKQQQEQQRIDFFRAVSHELKTPITVLKGELEGMIYEVGDYKDRDVYLRHSMKTVNDMEKIVQEIIAASRVAADDMALTLQEVRIDELVKECWKKLCRIAEDKQQNVIISVSACTYDGDENLLEKAISNIIGNAIAHSPLGADITITLQDDVLSVENSGVHLEEEYIERLFEPFYRVDKSRNADTGGSGLGLYIVKTIFDRHHLHSEIENTGTGVRFMVTFHS